MRDRGHRVDIVGLVESASQQKKSREENLEIGGRGINFFRIGLGLALAYLAAAGQLTWKDAASRAGRCAQLNAPYVGGVIAWNVTNVRC